MSVFMRSADASGAVVAVKVSNELNFSGNATVTTAASLRRHVEAVAKNERISKNNSNLRKTVVPPILAVQLVIEFGDFAG